MRLTSVMQRAPGSDTLVVMILKLLDVEGAGAASQITYVTNVITGVTLRKPE